MKKCENNSYNEGCIPDYQWTVSDGCSGFNASNIKNKSAYILNDGSIIFFYGGKDIPLPLIGFDVNGFKGPNKPGFDVYALSLVYNDGNLKFSTEYSITNCLPYMGGAYSLKDIMK